MWLRRLRVSIVAKKILPLHPEAALLATTNKMKKLIFLLLPFALATGCNRAPQGDEATETAGQTSANDDAPARKGVMQYTDLPRSTEELRLDSLNLRRIQALALQEKPTYATPREAVEAFMQAYIDADAPRMFHVCEVGFGPVEPQHVLDYQHMMEGLSKIDALPTAFAITETGDEGDTCPIIVDLTMSDGTTQSMRVEAYRLSSSRWRPLLK